MKVLKQGIINAYYSNNWLDSFIDMSFGALIYDAAIGGNNLALLLPLVFSLYLTQQIMEAKGWKK